MVFILSSQQNYGTGLLDQLADQHAALIFGFSLANKYMFNMSFAEFTPSIGGRFS